MEGGVGPTTSNSYSRPVRASSRNFYFNNGNSSSPAGAFTGPVRRWEKKWVHVSSSHLSTPKQSKQSNSPNNNSPIILCKWTPLSRSTACDGDKSSGELPRRKFRYTPIVVFEEQKKLAAKRVADKDILGEAHQPAKRLAMDTDDIYGILDINHDLMGAHQETSKSFPTPRYSSGSHFDLGLYSGNQKKGGQLDLMKSSGM